jgi:hypothetical protein
MTPAMVQQQQQHQHVINSYEQQQQAIQNSINAMMASGFHSMFTHRYIERVISVLSIHMLNLMNSIEYKDL